jgi:molecular chaperone DnaK
LSPAAPNAPLPLLIDVTPLSLTVETVSGFCDVIITRNTPVPCEQSRLFVTAQDGQESVHIRVGQGESARFSENTLLGELELTGLRRAERGKVRIEVAFELDTDGLLQVHAIDAESGKATSARLRLIGLPEAEEVDVLRARQAARPSA